MVSELEKSGRDTDKGTREHLDGTWRLGSWPGARRLESPAVKVLALDYGSARTGVAVSDPSGVIVRPLTTVERVGTKQGIERLLALVAEEQPARVRDSLLRFFLQHADA